MISICSPAHGSNFDVSAIERVESQSFCHPIFVFGVDSSLSSILYTPSRSSEGPGIPQKASSVGSLCLLFIREGFDCRTSEIGSTYCRVHRNECSCLCYNLEAGIQTNAFLPYLLSFSERRVRTVLAGEMTSTGSEIYNNHKIETLCEYQFGCLLCLWEGSI